METASSSRKEHDKPRRRWEWLLLLLALLMSFGCVFCASQLALTFWPNELATNMLARSQADYMGESGGFNFSALDPAVGVQAATDSARLDITPAGADGSSPVTISLLPPTPTPTTTPIPQPTLAATSTNIPMPTASSTPTSVTTGDDDSSTSGPTPASPSGGTTGTPQPSSTSVLPTATVRPTNTLQPTATVPPTSTSPPTATLPPSPTATSPPPPTATAPPPSPPTSPPPTSPPPTPTNSPPVAGNDTATTDENIATAPIQVLLNDSDSDGTLVPGSVTVVSGPNNGSIISINPATGDITYMPNFNFNGVDTFTYQVCDNGGACSTATVTVTVNPVNDPPVAMPNTATTAEDSSETIDVLLNDTDPDGDSLTIISAGPAMSGTVTINYTLPLNSVTYMPDPNINGIDVFTYTISDGILTDTTTVTVTIIPTNDIPEANPDSYTTDISTTLTITAAGVLTNDTDIDGDTLMVCFQLILCAGGPTSPANGALTMNPDGSFTYIPDPLFPGTYTFTYQAEDVIMTPSNVTTVTITVLP